ncbi:DNA translocase FtsK [uncultured Rikenella sp.]|uniref:FtsK/SpoIIIE family DNA translocase n=1 Tax=uncultured Rikenella sp. TaxID=368003 RepID=UPI002616FA8E|nr:DNA translocase FtsK [uncultured Rikenella sp.]
MAAKRQVDKLAERAVQDRRTSRASGQEAQSRRPVSRRQTAATAAEAKRPDRLRTERVQRVASRQPAVPVHPAGNRRSTPPAQQPKRRQRPAPKNYSTPPAPEEESTTDRYIWLSLILLFLSGYLAVSVISYLIYWDVDQNIATWGNLFTNVRQDAMNWGGRIGAIASQSIIGRWFGIFGELLPLVVFFIAIKLLRIKSLRLRRAIRSTILLMIVGSIAAGHFWGADPQVFGSGWGGVHGVFVARWLDAMIGYEGTTLLIIAAFCGTLYYANGLLIRSWGAKLRAYNSRKREERRIRQETERLRAKENILRMQEAMEKQRQELAMRQAAQPIMPEPQPGFSAVDTAAPLPDRTTEAITPVFQPDPVPQVSEAPVSPPVPAMQEPMLCPPADRARLVQNYDGSWGYLIGYDEWNQPIIYSFDRESYLYRNGYPVAAAAPNPVPETTPIEEEVNFTLETRPLQQEQAQETVPYSETEPQSVPLRSAIEPAVQAFAPQEDDPGFIVEQPEEEQVDDEVINNSDLYDPTLELSHYRKPPVELLDDHTKRVIVTDEELVENKNRIVTTLENFGIRIDTIEATIGPTVTLYEIVPAPGVRISKIKNLEDDIALSLAALGIRIIAPIPGKGTVGIEVPNKDKEVVSMYSVIKSPRFHDSKADLPVALGKTIQNETFVFDLAKMPHLLVAGDTGQGKSVGLNAIITSLLYKKHPAELKFILVDPKKVELTLYAKLEKHFLAKMPTEEEAIITDTQKVIYTLNSLCIEMDARYDLLKAAKVRNIKEYNEKFINRRLNPEKGHRYLPYFVVIVDEFADLIMTAGREIETPIARIAQLARAVGIHLIIATQRPTTNIITGVIKANFPARIAFRVTSMIDSRTILDQPGANQLVGRGDMLISTGSEITRVQCAFIDTPEVERITDHIEHQQGYPSAYELPEYTPEGEESSSASGGDMLTKRDSLFEEVARYVVANQQGSASTIQRKFSIGFNRAGRLIDQLEAAGIVGKSEGGGKPRQVLVNDPMSLETILDTLS